VLAPGITLTGMGPLGTVEFTDPALLHGSAPSRANDVYSLGATLHHVLAGVGLYGELPGNDPVLVLRRLLSTPPTIAPQLRPEEADVIRDCINPDPAQRPATALEVAERLEGISG